MKIPAGRVQELQKLQSWVFGKSFNPNNERIGIQVLRKTLRGPLIKDYYYPSLKLVPTAAKLNKIFPDWNCVDPDEVYRLQRVEHLKRKGKGAPKKLKEKKVVDKKPHLPIPNCDRSDHRYTAPMQPDPVITSAQFILGMGNCTSKTEQKLPKQNAPFKQAPQGRTLGGENKYENAREAAAAEAQARHAKKQKK